MSRISSILTCTPKIRFAQEEPKGTPQVSLDTDHHDAPGLSTESQPLIEKYLVQPMADALGPFDKLAKQFLPKEMVLTVKPFLCGAGAGKPGGETISLFYPGAFKDSSSRTCAGVARYWTFSNTTPSALKAELKRFKKELPLYMAKLTNSVQQVLISQFQTGRLALPLEKVHEAVTSLSCMTHYLLEKGGAS